MSVLCLRKVKDQAIFLLPFFISTFFPPSVDDSWYPRKALKASQAFKVLFFGEVKAKEINFLSYSSAGLWNDSIELIFDFSNTQKKKELKNAIKLNAEGNFLTPCEKC